MRSRALLSLLALTCAAATWWAWPRRGVPSPPPASRAARWFQEFRDFPGGAIVPGTEIDAWRSLRTRMARPGDAAAPDPSDPVQSWVPLGPRYLEHINVFGTPDASGRVNAVAADPRNPAVLYLGADRGGVWRSDDSGSNWRPLTDTLPFPGINALQLSPANPDVIYAGTENGAVLRSPDGGQTWAVSLLPTLREATPLGARVKAIAAHPRDPDQLLVAVDCYQNSGRSGVLRTLDGGVTWTMLLPLPGTIPTSVLFDAADPATIFATATQWFEPTNAGQGVYRSTDAGRTFAKIHGQGAAAVSMTRAKRLFLAQAPSNPATLYLLSIHWTTNSLDALYVTSDRGNNWLKLDSKFPNGVCGASSCPAFFSIAVHAQNPDVIYLGNAWLYRSADRGATFADVSKDKSGTIVHVDHRYLGMLADGTLQIGCDGGVYVGQDSGGSDAPVWTSLNARMGLTQFYPGLSLHPTDPLQLLAGTQDNSFALLRDGKWISRWTGDWMWSHTDPVNPNVAFTTSYPTPNNMVLRTRDNWRSFAFVSKGMDTTRAPWVSPLEMDPSDPKRLYFGTVKIFRTVNQGDEWTAISGDLTAGRGAITAVSVAPSDPDFLYVAANNGMTSLLYVNRAPRAAGEGRWETISKAALPARNVSRIAVSPGDARELFVTYSGNRAADKKGHVYYTRDGGVNWEDRTGTLPDSPVSDFAWDPDLSGVVYVSNDLGVFVSPDLGRTWNPLGAGLPLVTVSSIRIHRPTRTLRAATYGRGIWDLKVPSGKEYEAPVLTTASPGELKASPAAKPVVVTLTGSSFSPESAAVVNGVWRTARVRSDRVMEVVVTPDDLQAEGALEFRVWTPSPSGGVSDPVVVPVAPAMAAAVTARRR